MCVAIFFPLMCMGMSNEKKCFLTMLVSFKQRSLMLPMVVRAGDSELQCYGCVKKVVDDSVISCFFHCFNIIHKI